MTEDEDGYILISDQSDVDDLVFRINDGQRFGKQFKFKERDYLIALLEGLQIDYIQFEENYYFYDSMRKLHISESQFDYVWISTHGLIAKKKTTDNNSINACANQYRVITLLLEKSIEVSTSKSVFDVDSYNFGLLSDLTPAIFHNMLFYIEVLCKAYLSLSNEVVPHTHDLSILHAKVVDAMHNKGHNNSLFQVQILEPLYRFIDHVKSIPGNFKEHFVKYDDNSEDDTVIIFDAYELRGTLSILEISNDFIMDYFYTGSETFYLKTGLYQKFLDRCKTDEERKRIQQMYSHLVENE